MLMLIIHLYPPKGRLYSISISSEGENPLEATSKTVSACIIGKTNCVYDNHYWFGSCFEGCVT